MSHAPVRPDLTGRRILVTGADGFIGSHLVEAALAAGAQVRAFCLYTSFGTAGWLDDSEAVSAAVAEGRLEIVLGDIRDPQLVASAVAGCDTVFHLAALIAIPHSYVAPRSYVDTNIGGTLNVLDAVRTSGTALLVNTSTSEVYGTPETVPITEAHPLRGQSPYSATKIAADKLCEAYALSFDTPVVTLRPFNTYGPRQSARAVIPTVLAQLLSGATELRLGAVSPRRDFTFVTDTCAGFLHVAVADLAPGATVQLGTGATYSIGEVVERCLAVTGTRAKVVVDDQRLRPAGSEVQILVSDPTRAREWLAWEPAVGLDEGLRRTAQWLASRVDPVHAGRYQT